MGHAFRWVRRRIEPIGIDIGARYVRMVQFARHHGQISALDCRQRILPCGLSAAGERSRIVAEAVSDMLAEGNFIGRDVVTALSWQDLFSRNLRIPNMPPEEIEPVVAFESAERFGVEPDQAEIRFMISGDVRQGTEVRQEVLVFGAARERIHAHVRMLEDLRLRPAAIDAGPCAVFRGFERFFRRDEDRGKVNAFVDLGYSGTRVIISRGSDLIFFKAIPVGGERFDELVSERLDLTLEDARQIRTQSSPSFEGPPGESGRESPGGPPGGNNTRHAVLDAIRPALDQLGKEIALCLRYCSVTFRGLRSELITAVGGEARNRDMLRVLSDHVNVPFRVGEPMRNVTTECGADTPDRRAGQPEWATAVGLALKSTGGSAEVAA